METVQRHNMPRVERAQTLRFETCAFGALRSDWYSSNQHVPRALIHACRGTRRYRFAGFPRQWLPVFEWYGVPWEGSVEPAEYIPFFSDWDEGGLVEVCHRAKQAGMLRVLLESASVYDALIADCIYIVDNSLEGSIQKAAEFGPEFPNTRKRTVLLNSWLAYGRPEVRDLSARCMQVRQGREAAVILPCSISRPYDRSRTHRSIYDLLQMTGYRLETFDRIVLTSLGVIPQELWNDQIVMSYDAGVPDIYRLLRLAREFFGSHVYATVLDCTQFRPYRDILGILEREGLIKKLIRVPGLTMRRAFVARSTMWRV